MNVGIPLLFHMQHFQNVCEVG